MQEAIFNTLAGIVLLVAIYLSAKTSILKDSEIGKPQGKEKMFSFSRTQAMWWTTIIACCFIIGCGVSTTYFVNLNPTCLVLLGIGVSTNVVGRIIDSNDKSNLGATVRFQDKIETHGFFKDILRDGETSNFSVHRFQALVFTFLALWIPFPTQAAEALRTQAIPAIDLKSPLDHQVFQRQTADLGSVEVRGVLPQAAQEG